MFIFLLKNIDCGYLLEPPRRGGSNEYPQSMFLSRNLKINDYPCKSQFYCIKVRFKGSKLYRLVFVMKVIDFYAKVTIYLLKVSQSGKMCKYLAVEKEIS